MHIHNIRWKDTPHGSGAGSTHTQAHIHIRIRTCLQVKAAARLSTHRPRENHTAQGVCGSAAGQVTFQLKSHKSLTTRWVTASMDSSLTTKGTHCNNDRAPYVLQWMLVVIKCRDVVVAEGGEDMHGVMKIERDWQKQSQDVNSQASTSQYLQSTSIHTHRTTETHVAWYWVMGYLPSAQLPAHDVLRGLQARHTCTYTHTHTHTHTQSYWRECSHAHLATTTTLDHDLHNFMIAQSIYSIMLHEL